MVDTRHNDSWHGKLEVYGVADPLLLQGTIERINIDAMLYLRNLREIKANRDGVKVYSLTIQSKPFDHVPTHGLDADFLAHLDMSLVTHHDDHTLTQLYGAGAPWNEDEDWKQFRGYMASESRYATAAPGEIKLLMDRLKAKFGGTEYDGLKFDDILVDRRKP